MFKEQSIRRAALVSFTYILIATAYIITSTLYARAVVEDVEKLAQIETLKGVAFIAITGTFLFFIVEIQLRRMQRSKEVMEAQRRALMKSEQRAIAGVYASALAHDANNMLCAIKMGLDLLKHNGPINAAQSKSLQDIKTAIDKLGEINHRLIGVNRLDQRSTITPIKVNEQIQESLRYVRMHENLSSKHLVVECEKDFQVVADPLMFQQAMVNLMLNAGEATSIYGNVKVRVKEEGEWGVVEVHDDGPGVHQDAKQMLFQPFFTTKSKGHGLGLLAVKGFVDACRGEIQVTKSPDLGGAMFKLMLPLNGKCLS